MCLSTVYQLQNGEKKKLCEYVRNVDIKEDGYVFTDVMGIQTAVSGTIQSMDLVKNEIVLDTHSCGV